MAEPVSAITIVSTVVKAVTTTVTTVQTISDYVSRYKIADIQVVAMKTECSTVLSALLQLQDIIIQSDILQRPTAGSESRTLAYVQTDYRGILSQCFAVFTLLNERLAKLKVEQLNKRSQSSAKAKIRTVWFGDSMRILRENIKGHVSAITLLLAAFQAASSARITDSVAANTESIMNNTQMLEKVFQMLTRRDNAALLKRVADDARSLSSLPLARRVIEQNEDSHSIFERRESMLKDWPEHRELYRKPHRVQNRIAQDKGKGKMIGNGSLDVETSGSTEMASVQDSDRFSFVTARSKIIPSIKSMLGSRSASKRTSSSSDSTLYGASTIRRVPLFHVKQVQPQMNFEMQPAVTPVQTPNGHDVPDGGASAESLDELQDEQKARWEYLMELSPHQVILDRTIDEYEETEKEFEERAKSLKAQISG